jgi:hypothetical protein
VKTNRQFFRLTVDKKAYEIGLLIGGIAMIAVGVFVLAGVIRF